LSLSAWHGMTALHRACLGGDYNIILLLLRAGADPNAPNANQETPTLFSCKRGNTQVLNLMIEFGGDVSKIDSQGRGAMLHAAESGIVSTLHYLNTVCNHSFKVVDNKRQSPIHIVCLYGHVEALKYLIKKDRCDLTVVNMDGDTPLHILSREGHSHLCWVIFTELGTSSLKVLNNAGYTPKDLAEQRDKMGHREITPVYQYYSKQGGHIKPTGPILYWYWLLLMPTIIYGAAVVLSHYVNEKLHAVTILLGLAVILITQKKQLHRMRHVSRWPNPIYIGIFGAGQFHTMVCLYYKLMQCIFLNFFFFANKLSFMCMFYNLYFAFPNKNIRYQEVTVQDLCSPVRKMQDFCADCEIVRPKYAKHCKLCNKCYQDMDHHCLFLNRCVARDNQFYFVWFILTCLVCMTIFVIIAALHCYSYYSMMRVLYQEVWMLSLIIMNTVSLIWGINLIKNQFDVIANDFTNYFRTKGYNQLLTVNEKWLNIAYFLIGKEPYIKNPLHKQLNV
ncbi:hypothetical protein LOTGIDRAFT_141812, partial [Lottia gigantea]